MQEIMSPHFNDRKSEIDMLVFHCSDHPAHEMLDCLNAKELSVHYIINVDGEIIKAVEEKNRAWHAGNGFWRGIDNDINSHSIGIEISNMSMGQKPYSEEQIQKLIFFVQKILRKYKIAPQNIVAHSDIAPLRKADP